MTQRKHQDNPDSAGIKPPAKGEKSRPAAPKIPKKITATYLQNSGLYYLQRFAASSAQFRRVMQRKIDKSCKAHPDQDRDECINLLNNLIEAFQRSGLLNDEMFATGAIRSLRQRGLSTRAIEARMAIKGIPATLVKQTLGEIDSLRDINPDLLAALKHARKRRIGPYTPVDKGGDHRDKQLAAMARAGFDFEIAQKVMKFSKEEAEELIGSSGW